MKHIKKALSVVLAAALLLTLFAASAVTTSAAVSTAPDLKLTNSNSGMTATWNKVPGAYSYIVYYRDNPSLKWNFRETSDSSFVFAVNNYGLQQGKKFYVQVKAVDFSGNGKFSKVKSLTYLQRGQISQLSCDGSVIIGSEFRTGANGFQIAKTKYGEKRYEYYTVNEAWLYRDANVTQGKCYTYQVRPMYKTKNNGTAYGAWSPSKSICVLNRPTVKLSNKSNGIRAEWNKVAGAAGYRVYYRSYDEASWSYADIKDNYCPLIGTQSGTLYYIQVQPLAANGIGGGYSKVKSLTYLDMPYVGGEFEDGELYFWFEEIDGANLYQIAIREESETEYQYAFLDYHEYGYELPVPEGYHFRVQVRAMYQTEKNGTAYGAWSKTAHIYT